MTLLKKDLTADHLESFEAALSEQALFLAPLSSEIASRWSELYLNTFGRSAFFSVDRVQKTLKELTEIFVGCLKERCLDVYFDNLKDRGRVFSRLGVPFEEVLLSMHLFEEVCVEKFLEFYPDRSKLTSIILASEELHSHGLTVIAASYFEMTKKEMQAVTDSFREDNEELRNELLKTKNSLFFVAHKEMQAMQLAISSINHKLRTRLNQLGRIQKITEALDHEGNFLKLLSLAAAQLLRLCPANTEILFGFIDTADDKVTVYTDSLLETSGYEETKSFYFSEIAGAFREALVNTDIRYQPLQSPQEIPAAVMEALKAKSQREFLLLPMRKYAQTQGFILISADTEGFFSKNNYKFFQRVGQTVSQALLAALVYDRLQKERRLNAMLTEITRKKAARRAVEAIDLCLGSLMEMLGAERSSLMRYDGTKKELKVFAAKGLKIYPISGLCLKWGEGVAGIALKNSKMVSVAKMKEPDGQKNVLTKLFKQKPSREVRVKSLLCIPLFFKEEPLGVINLSTLQNYKNFSPSEIEMARPILHRICDILKESPFEPEAPGIINL